jgi:hypothetical protein
MQREDVVNKALDYIESNDLNSSKSLYSDDFTFSGPVPVPLNKAQYLELMGKVLQGVPNWNFHRHDLRVEGDTVIVPVRVAGTQTGRLPGLMPDMPDLPATNRSFRNPPEEMRITVRGDRIVDVNIEPVPGGGVLGMLEQLGVSVPVTGKPPEKPKK